ncbi:sericin-2-like, partial [Penaeus indicus]|uniref:sericin-2-like n=1 Tax=Penaeus indicus TaxID=29960 RepID=UPI00300D842A
MPNAPPKSFYCSDSSNSSRHSTSDNSKGSTINSNSGSTSNSSCGSVNNSSCNIVNNSSSGCTSVSSSSGSTSGRHRSVGQGQGCPPAQGKGRLNPDNPSSPIRNFNETSNSSDIKTDEDDIEDFLENNFNQISNVKAFKTKMSHNYYSSFTVTIRGKDINPDLFLESDVFPNNVK